MTQERWEREIDALFEVLDPKNGHSQEESDKAVDEFIDRVNTEKANQQGGAQC